MKFETALEEYLAARGDNEGLLIDWVVITAHHIDDGESHTMTANGIYGPSHQRLHNALGLVSYAKLKIENRANG